MLGPAGLALHPKRSCADASCLLAEYLSPMTNRFGVVIHLDSVRWAAAEGVSETVIAAVLLLHERGVGEDRG